MIVDCTTLLQEMMCADLVAVVLLPHLKQLALDSTAPFASVSFELPLGKCVESMIKSVIDKLTVLFKNAHALSLAGRPFSDFECMCQLDTVKGLDIGKTYLNCKRAKEFTYYIAKIHMNNIKNSIDQVRLWG